MLVELRGFDPLTSAMRTQPGRLAPPYPAPLFTTSAQASSLAERGVVVRCGAARGVAADDLLTAGASQARAALDDHLLAKPVGCGSISGTG